MKPREERLAELLASVEKMAGGAVEHRIEISTAHDELDALGFAINVLIGELSFSATQLAQAKEDAERRSAELAAAHESLLAKDRLATLGQLAGGVAHQIRNPLAIIQNATSLLERNLPATQHPEVASSIGIIREEIRRADRIVTALLDYARLKRPTPKAVSLVELIDRVLAFESIPENVTVERKVTPDLPLMHVDEDQLHDAILNLVRNAVEAMPEGGTLTIELGHCDETVVIAVADTGVGIPPAVEARLFEPLHSTKPTGVGLGLVTARTFVNAHGGQIALVPRSAGACFEIRLPRQALASKPPPLR